MAAAAHGGLKGPQEDNISPAVAKEFVRATPKKKRKLWSNETEADRGVPKLY